ncbi:MAG: M1 family metallopeptidase [Gemmatimonadota bacterium]|nr:M1 family metallopeptidase [Gemmatimonadota bacterium]
MPLAGSPRAPGARLAAAIVIALAAPALPAQEARPDTLHTYRPGIDVLDYDLTLDLPDTGAVISGRAAITVRRTRPVDTLVLDLVRLPVDSVLVNGAPAEFARDSATIRIVLPRSTGDSLAVVVRYGGPVTDGLIVRKDPQGRWTYFGDNWPNRARHWIPSVDHPSDKATVTWTVRAPSERRVVANGTLVVEAPAVAPPSGQSKPYSITRWRMEQPIPVYLMVIGAAPLVYYDLGKSACGLAEQGGCVPQSVYIAPEVAANTLDGLHTLPSLRAVDGIVHFFARLVAPFPYEKLAHVQSATRFGGMENATAIFYSDRAFREGTLGEGLIAHETAHQWFGDAVTGREWGHLWLSEGFATYFAELWTEHSKGDSAFRQGMAQIRDRIVKSEATAARPVIDTAETDYLKLLNTNSYQKGGWVLHMLRAVIGDSAFFSGIRSYYTKHRHGTVLTRDLQIEVERSSSEPLEWFFDQWLRRPGHAELTTQWRYDERTRRVLLEVEQGGRWPPYRFPLVVEVQDAAGTARRAIVQVPATRTQRLTIPIALDRAPRAVTLDPDVQLLATFTAR